MSRAVATIVFVSIGIVTTCAVGGTAKKDCGIPVVEMKPNEVCPMIPDNNRPLCEEFLGVFHCDYAKKQWGLTFGYCITIQDNKAGYIFSGCPYLVEAPSSNLTNFDHFYYVLPDNTSQINTQVCHLLNREGDLCRNCTYGHGPTVFSFDLKCEKCHWYGLPLYLLLEFLPITVFFLVIVIFQISITSPPMTAFVMYCQAFANVIPSDPLIYNYAEGVSPLLLKVGLSVSGIWSLDFFRAIIPPFCVSSRLRNIHVYMLAYVSGLYPLLLIGFTYTLIELHARNFRSLVWLWRPFGVCFARIRRSWNPKSSVMNAFATFVLLAYTRLLFVSFTFLYPRRLIEVDYKRNDCTSHTVLQMDPQKEFFGKTHIPYAMFAIIVLIVFVLFPALLLCLYPTRLASYFLCCCKHRRSEAIRAFVECFQGCYKDGTGGTWDLRWVSSLYLFLRIFVVAQFLGLQSKDWSGVAAYNEIFINFGAALFIVIVRPYKSNRMNILDSLILALMGLLVLLFQAWRKNFSSLEELSMSRTMWYGIYFLASIPFICLGCYICYSIFKIAAKRILPRKKNYECEEDSFLPTDSLLHRSLQYSSF